MTINKDTLPEFNRKLLDSKPRKRLWKFINTCGKVNLLNSNEWFKVGQHVKLYEIAQHQWWQEDRHEQ